jgi:uncharacterized Rmd1/YagE family protein
MRPADDTAPGPDSATRHALRVEWYIVALIMTEITLSL